MARAAGLDLDPWQALCLEHALGERPDGKWSAFEVGLVVPRQNGKGSILEARELAGLFLLDERLIIHSAHEFATSLEAFRRLLFLIESNPDFDREVQKVTRSHGEEGIELKSGQRIRFRTRTKGGGRGFTGDTVILDEAMILPETAVGALMPTMSARPNPQLWYAASAVDQDIHEHGIVLARLRDRALKGGDDSLAYMEWSPDCEIEDADLIADDPGVWASANPGLGIRISTEHVQKERRSMAARTFAVERLNIGDWPNLEALDGQLITDGMWASVLDEDSVPEDPVCFAFDVTPDRGTASIGMGARRGDGSRHVEVIDNRPGTSWVVPRLIELRDTWRPLAVKCDERGPAAALLSQAKAAGLEVETINGSEMAQACGQFLDAVSDKTVWHRGDPELRSAVRGAARRPLGDAWAWSRSKSSIDISPLVAVTVALQGVEDERPSAYEEHGLIVV